jgi:hypothetical protein
VARAEAVAVTMTVKSNGSIASIVRERAAFVAADVKELGKLN